MEPLAIALILLESSVLFVVGCLLLLFGAFVIGKSQSALATGRAHVAEASSSESVVLPAWEPSSEPTPSGAGLNRRPPDIQDDAALVLAYEMERRELERKAARGNMNTEDFVDESEMIGPQSGMYVPMATPRFAEADA